MTGESFFVNYAKAWLPIWLSVFGLLVCTPFLAVSPFISFEPGWPSWRVFIVAIAIGPVCEAIIFRGGIHSGLHRLGCRYAWLGLSLTNWLTSALFAAAHLWAHSWLWSLAVFPMGLLFGWGYDVTGRHIAAPWLLHVTANGAFFLLLAY